MNKILLFCIKIYWLVIPESFRRSCLFKESCSRYVYRITKENGFIEGVKAFKTRYKKCRPGSKWIKNEDSGSIDLHLVDGTILTENETYLCK